MSLLCPGFFFTSSISCSLYLFSLWLPRSPFLPPHFLHLRLSSTYTHNMFFSYFVQPPWKLFASPLWSWPYPFVWNTVWQIDFLVSSSVVASFLRLPDRDAAGQTDKQEDRQWCSSQTLINIKWLCFLRTTRHSHTCTYSKLFSKSLTLNVLQGFLHSTRSTQRVFTLLLLLSWPPCPFYHSFAAVYFFFSLSPPFSLITLCSCISNLIPEAISPYISADIFSCPNLRKDIFPTFYLNTEWLSPQFSSDPNFSAVNEKTQFYHLFLSSFVFFSPPSISVNWPWPLSGFYVW